MNVPAFLTNPFAFSQVLLQSVLIEGKRYVGNSTINTESSFFNTVLVSKNLLIMR